MPASQHATFYAAQQFTLNATRADMALRGYAPSVRLFEAAACGVPVISDRWPGIQTLFTPDEEILIAERASDVIAILGTMTDERRRTICMAARRLWGIFKAPGFCFTKCPSLDRLSRNPYSPRPKLAGAQVSRDQWPT